MRNEHLELNQGFAGGPETSACEQLRDVYHSKDVALGPVAALFLARLQAQLHGEPQKNKYRDEHHTPLPGTEGDLAQSCDEQLLDVFMLIKRMLDERAAFLRSRDDLRAAEESSHGPAEQQTGSALGDGAATHARPTDTEPPTDAPLNRGRLREALRDIPREHPMNPPDPWLANAEANEGELLDDGSSSGRRLGETYQPAGGISAGERALTDR